MSTFRKSVEKIQVSLKSDKNNGTLHEDQYNNGTLHEDQYNNGTLHEDQYNFFYHIALKLFL